MVGDLTNTNTLSQSGPGSNDNEGLLHNPKRSRSGASPSDCLVSYPGHSLGESYPSAEMQSVYFIALCSAIDHLKDCLHIFVISEYHNSPPQLFQCVNKSRTLVVEETYYSLIFPRAKQYKTIHDK